ncbi:hypothetical protein THRCLA_03211 [Thraustotheca clavata]|uniref:MalT-like TPR region domain-containing protein n=1 Tax=Thraustotheca clavata TaxID=74557 RepID=A0A1W0A2Q2_9STRA|nr:hypothetical protein THRCLA_03211 [Thraustotheca clavata]
MKKTIDRVDENLTNCLASLGVLCLMTQELQHARLFLKRVALLDKCEEGPSSLITLESQLNIAAVYRNEGRYKSAIDIVEATLSTVLNNKWESGWCDVLCNCWISLGVLFASIGDAKHGCSLLKKTRQEYSIILHLGSVCQMVLVFGLQWVVA